MYRRFNFTGRQKLLREHIRLLLSEETRYHSFLLELDLHHYLLPPDALIFVEASKRTLFKRFHWGTVSSMIPPEDTSLEGFGEPEAITFRIKITGSGANSGKILAVANGLKLLDHRETRAPRQPLLPVRSEDLGGPLWRVDFGESITSLFVESRFNKDDLVANPMFAATVFPSALREILQRIYVEGYEGDWRDATAEDWQALWLRFASVELGCGDPPLQHRDHYDREEYLEWAETVIKAFCKRHDLLSKVIQSQKGGIG